MKKLIMIPVVISALVLSGCKEEKKTTANTKPVTGEEAVKLGRECNFKSLLTSKDPDDVREKKELLCVKNNFYPVISFNGIRNLGVKEVCVEKNTNLSPKNYKNVLNRRVLLSQNKNSPNKALKKE